MVCGSVTQDEFRSQIADILNERIDIYNCSDDELLEATADILIESINDINYYLGTQYSINNYLRRTQP